MYINNLKLATLIIYFSKNCQFVTSIIIYAPKSLTICHHVVNKSAQVEGAYFEINGVILQKIQIRV